MSSIIQGSKTITKTPSRSKVEVIDSKAFASKVLPDGKKLFKRVHGVSAAATVGVTDVVFTVPYANCKLTSLEIINAEIGDTINLKILDTDAGTVSGVPNYMLNQFGFDVNIAKDFYRHSSEYDADLFLGLKIKIEYTSVSAKTIYANIILNEVK